MTPPVSPPASRSAVAWLALGAALGLGAAVVGLLGSGLERERGSSAAAWVDGEPIRRDELERAIAALAADRREPLGSAERRHVLERLIDEELLVQRGLELGLARHDRRVRGDLVAAVIEMAVSQAGDREPGTDELRRFYTSNRDYFARRERLWVERIWVGAGTRRSEAAARERAEEALARLRAGEDFARVEGELGDPQVARIPSDLLPTAKLREYLGPSAAEAAAALAEGEVSEPLPGAGGFAVIRLVERAPAQAPPFAEIEAAVAGEWRRRAGDRALRRYLAELRERTDVRVAEDPP